jgi:hypothetical protein
MLKTRFYVSSSLRGIWRNPDAQFSVAYFSFPMVSHISVISGSESVSSRNPIQMSKINDKSSIGLPVGLSLLHQYHRTTPWTWWGEAGIAQSVYRETGVRVPVGSRIFSSPCRPDRFCGPPILLSNGYRGLFPRRLSGRGVKLTTHLQIAVVKKIWIYRSSSPYAFMA